MKSFISTTGLLMAICAVLFSFSPKPGGEGFEISLNNKVVVQKYGTEMNAVQNLQLNTNSLTDVLTIRYHHCGKVSKNRVIIIKDGQNKTVKEFKYADAATASDGMIVRIKELVNLKSSGSELKLYYFSTELPAGRMLATFVL